jgi:hypothetical protein
LRHLLVWFTLVAADVSEEGTKAAFTKVKEAGAQVKVEPLKRVVDEQIRFLTDGAG